MAEAVGEEAARKAWAAYGRGGCCDEHLEDSRGDGMTESGWFCRYTRPGELRFCHGKIHHL